jgi:hypothetical protein
VNLLKSSLENEATQQKSSSLMIPSATCSTPSSPTAPGPPAMHPPPRPAHSSLSQPSPTNRIISHVIRQNGYLKANQVRLIDTPGLQLGENDILHEKERERGMAGLLRMMEERFALVFKGENRIVRRKHGVEDDIVHLGQLADTFRELS